MSDAARTDSLVGRLDDILDREVGEPFSQALNAIGAFPSPAAADAWTALAALLTEAAECATQLAAIARSGDHPTRPA
jgi:hypothetical protein